LSAKKRSKGLKAIEPLWNKEAENMSIPKYRPGRVMADTTLAFNGVCGWKLPGIVFLIAVMLVWASAIAWAQSEPAKQPTGGIGSIDRIAEDVIVIDDVLYKLASNVIFYENDKLYTYANRSAFIGGTSVGFKFNESREVVAVWFSK
jgi:hypothetical protein